MTTHYCNIDSLEGLEEAMEFFDENHGRFDSVVFRVTGCEPLATAPDLLREVKRAKQLGGNLSIEGLDDLKALSKRAREVSANKKKLERMRAEASRNSENPEPTGDPEHTTTWHHSADMDRLRSCVANMDIDAMRDLDKDVDANIARFEHHRARVADVAEAATNHYIPDMSDVLWGSNHGN